MKSILMKFLKGAFAICLVLMVMASFSNAHAITAFSQNSECEMYVSANTTNAYKETAVSTSTIIPAYHRILGVNIVPLDISAGSEFIFVLHDGANANSTANIFDEAEYGQDEEKKPYFYPHPKRLITGLTIVQGANSVVIVYYEDTRKK